MHVRHWAVAIGLATLVLAAPGAGGLRAQELQVPVDEAGRIQVITGELARRLGLFGEIQGFREARLFQLPDATFVLEITSDPGGGLRRERRPLSVSEAAEFRRDVTSRIAARAPSAVLDQGGRTKLLVGTTLLGLGFYGWAAEEAFDPTDDQTAVALYMLTAAGSFFVPFLATRAVSVSDGAATMALWGATRGPIHGLLAETLGEPREPYDPDRDQRRFAWSVAVGATEAVAGGLITQALSMTPGRAELTAVGGDLGLGIGWGIADLFELDERFRTITAPDGAGGTYTFDVADRTARSAVTLAGSGLGLVGGYLMGASRDWTRGDAIVFRNVTMMGGLAGIAAGDIIRRPETITDEFGFSYVEDGFTRAHSAAGLIGTGAGMVLGRALVSGRNFTTSQGTLLSLSPLAGGLLGLGLAYLAAPDEVYDPQRDDNRSELYLTATAVGAAAGFAALYPAMAKQAKSASLGSNLQFMVNPLAPAQVLRGSRGTVPLASINYRF